MDANFGYTPWAAAKVTGGTGASTMAHRCVSARTGQGVYTITLDLALDATERSIQITCLTADSMVSYVDTTDNVITVSTFDNAAAAQDRDFNIVVCRCI